MSAVASAGGDDDVSWHRLRAFVGHQVAVDTDSEHVEGTLLSCTARSAWIVSGDEDHVVALPHLRIVHDLS
jgi:hypothetical protein